jgi:predicted amidohydrolase YtcJ
VPAVDPPGGVIVRDAQGTPTGIFVDNAMDLISKIIPVFNVSF